MDTCSRTAGRTTAWRGRVAGENGRSGIIANQLTQRYGWQATGWLNLEFDTQYVINLGGRGYNAAGLKTDNAMVLGLGTEVHF
ncbi:carbohydrate porin [Bradyrhizobium sp. 143]|nr:carbohydrate porin [Bradyrhizobium sp. 143]MCK1727456.1 carbohydrate porin [Bradyrhizobium sp. 142]